ncbi:MAG TPA: hypothetical protein VJY39_18040 [Acidisphaera sp.]|nr:hypothetical protein [Acidisphaera sp.]
MSLPSVLVVWLVLLGRVGLEFVLGSRAAPMIGAGLAILVALTFMRLVRTPGLPAAFALAAVFWLAVLLGLGSLDPATRHDVPAPSRTETSHGNA